MRILGIYLLSLSGLLAENPRITDLGISTYSFGEWQVADIDGDGDQDFVSLPLYFATGSNQFTWFENIKNGSFTFQKHLGYTNSRFNQPYFIGDTNKDGTLEFLSLSIEEPITEIYIRDPLGTGDQSHLLKTPDVGRVIPFFVNIDQDHEPVVFLFPYDSTESFTIFEFSTEGTLRSFSEKTYLLPDEFRPNFNDGVRASDLDGDGDRDLIMFDDSPDRTLVYERISPTEFSDQPVTIIDGAYSESLDIDDDGDLDLHQIDEDSWARNDGNFSFHTSDELVLPSGNPIRTPQGLRILEISDDFVEYQLQDDGSWQESFRQEVPELPTFDLALYRDNSESLAADLNGDLFDEITLFQFNGFQTLSYDAPTYHITSFIRTINGYEEFSSSAPPLSIDYTNPVTADFDNDGDIDILMGPSHLGHHYLKLNDGEGNFTLSEPPLNFYPEDLDPAEYKITYLKAVHFDSDEHLDLAITFERAVNSWQVESACTIIKGTGLGTFAPTQLPHGSFSFVQQGFCNITEFVDWDSDGDLDAIMEGGWRENINGELSPFFRPILSNVPTTDALGNPILAKGYKIADVDGDGIPDYISSAYSFRIQNFYADPITGEELDIPFPSVSPINYLIGSKKVPQAAVAFNSGDGAISEIVSIDISALSTDALGNPVTHAFHFIDLNADGQKEIISPVITFDALGTPFAITHQVWTMPEGQPRNFTDATITNIPSLFVPDSDILVDFDGDGTLEYAVHNRFIQPSPNGPQVSPQYSFTEGISLSHRASTPSPTNLADFDGDGDLDALVSDRTSRLSLVRNLLVDERSAITRILLSAGLTGAQSDPSADPDGDGLSNSMEYLSGTNPFVSDAQSAADLSPNLKVTKGIPELSFIRRKDAKDFSLDYRLERSTDLLNWHPIPTDSAKIESLNHGWDQVTVEDSLTNGTFFYRTNPQHRP
ncbi:VCBS repeat-containing protein [Akkermansiaceae bacterium]|nr:VCBS repeat-containing protein [Akkermansiaceae bacterium]